MIEVDSLKKAYGATWVLQGVGFAARPGEVTLMIGPNGAGKSSTLKSIAGLVQPDGGCVRVAGHDLRSDRWRALSALSFLPQTPAFHPRFSVDQLLRFYARLRGVSPDRVGQVCEQAGLKEVRSLPSRSLSGGLRQRLGFAILMISNAPVLLLDEPGLSLDPVWRRRLQSFLRAEAARGRTVLVTTHLVAEWNGATDRCLLCRNERIVAEVDPGDLGAVFASTDSCSPSRGAASAGAFRLIDHARA